VHSWVFRNRDRLQRIYGLPEALLEDEGWEPDEAPAETAQPAPDPTAEDGDPSRPRVRRVAVTPMPRRVR
jgi:hypothetical protein